MIFLIFLNPFSKLNLEKHRSLAIFISKYKSMTKRMVYNYKSIKFRKMEEKDMNMEMDEQCQRAKEIELKKKMKR